MPCRRAVTLLELLIVMTIMLMVTAAAIPIMMPAIQNRRMREAARLTSSFISGARARAIELGRPVGVMFERYNGLPMAMQLSYVEIPEPYSGDTVASILLFKPDGTNVAFQPGDATWENNIRSGDLIQFNHKNAFYRIIVTGQPWGTLLTTGNRPQWLITMRDESPVFIPSSPEPFVDVPVSVIPPIPGNGAYDLGEPFTDNNGDGSRTMYSGLPYKIYRSPVRSASTPLQLPDTTVVDLTQSGIGSSGVLPTPIAYNPVVMFSPNGSVDSVILNTPFRPSGPLYLLIGRRDLMADVALSGTDENLFDPMSAKQHLSNFWISVAHQTGQVSVSENAQNSGDVMAARAFAQSGQSAGGR